MVQSSTRDAFLSFPVGDSRRRRLSRLRRRRQEEDQFPGCAAKMVLGFGPSRRSQGTLRRPPPRRNQCRCKERKTRTTTCERGSRKVGVSLGVQATTHRSDLTPTSIALSPAWDQELLSLSYPHFPNASRTELTSCPPFLTLSFQTKSTDQPWLPAVLANDSRTPIKEEWERLLQQSHYRYSPVLQQQSHNVEYQHCQATLRTL